MTRLAGIALCLVVATTALLTTGAQASTWTLNSVPMPSTGKEATARGVSCASTFCASVGDFWNSSIWGASGDELVEPGAWKSAEVQANVSGGKNGDLRGVSCWKAQPTEEEPEPKPACWAAGAYGTSGGVGTPLVESRREGVTKWEQEPAGTSPGNVPEFRGISCVLAGKYCLAVGQFDAFLGADEAAFAQEWNSVKWVELSAPQNPGNKEHGHLTSVSCRSKTFCMAAGGWGREVLGKEVIQAGSMTYNSTEKKWAAIEAKEPATAENGDFYAISCTSTTFCMAVGNWKENPELETGGPTRILADIWNGTEWTVSLSSGPASINEGTLRGVSCPSAEECEAVGDYITTSLKEEPLAYIYKEKKWERQTIAAPETATASALEAVSCKEAKKCQATGTESTSTFKFLPFGASL